MNFRVIWDQPEPCPYLPEQVARLPLRVPPTRLTPIQLDEQLAAGDRRSGRLLYRPTCPSCSACEPLRVDVARFEATKAQRRVWRKNVDELRITVGPPKVDATRLTLYNRHKLERGLSRTGDATGDLAYRQWLVDSCCLTVEVDYWADERLVAVSILDLGQEAASSVYHYFDPDESRRSLGVFSALAEMAWLRQRGVRWYYLGLYVQACDRLSYKADYRPNERLVGGEWVAG